MSAAAAFAATEAIKAGEWDEYLFQLNAVVKGRLDVLHDRSQPPPMTTAMLASGHQVWAWMNGPGKGHWEIRGTGAQL